MAAFENVTMKPKTGEKHDFIKRFIVFLSHAWINVDKDIDDDQKPLRLLFCTVTKVCKL